MEEAAGGELLASNKASREDFGPVERGNNNENGLMSPAADIVGPAHNNRPAGPRPLPGIPAEFTQKFARNGEQAAGGPVNGGLVGAGAGAGLARLLGPGGGSALVATPGLSCPPALLNNSGDASDVVAPAALDNLPPDILLPTAASSNINTADITAPQADQEVIAISDDEDEDLRTQNQNQNIFMTPSQRPLNFPLFRQSRRPIPMPFSSMPGLPPMAQHPAYLTPRAGPGPSSEVITLSDDDEDQSKPGGKRKRAGRRWRRGPMFSPQLCAFCRRPKRDNICMARHLIKHHWLVIRRHNGGNQKGSDYLNLKDDREIPVERGGREEMRQERLGGAYPGPGLHLPPSHSRGRPPYQPGHTPGPPRSLVEQPLRPSFPPASQAAAVRPGRQEESRNLSAEVTAELGHPDNRQLVQQQLGLLLHAHKCESRATRNNSFFQENKDCALPNCKYTRELLRHLPGCTAQTDCPRPKCFVSKQVVKWALSGEDSGQLKETRSELHRQAKAGLPAELVQWALTSPSLNKNNWAEWRQRPAPVTEGSHSSLPLPSTSLLTRPAPTASLPADLRGVTITPAVPTSRPTNGVPVTAAGPPDPAERSTVPEWKRKYIEAAAKRRGNQAAQQQRTAEAEPRDRIVPSQAPPDFLANLLNSQEESNDLRTTRKPQRAFDKRYQNSKTSHPGLTVSKLPNIGAPAEAASSGEDAAMYNEMLSL